MQHNLTNYQLLSTHIQTTQQLEYYLLEEKKNEVSEQCIREYRLKREPSQCNNKYCR